MKLIASILIIAFLDLAFAAHSFAQTAQSAVHDPIQQSIDEACIAHVAALDQARKSLLDAFDAQIKAAAANPDAAKNLLSQESDFNASRKIPTDPAMRSAVHDHQTAVQRADAVLLAVYDKSIADYNAASQWPQVDRVAHQRELFLAGLTPSQDDPADATLTPAAIQAALDQAKIQHDQTIAAARQEWISVVDARITAVTAAGNLDAVKNLQAARATILSNGKIPDDLDDPDISAGKLKYQDEIDAAEDALGSVYRQSVRDLTRLHQFDAADKIDREMATAGFGSSANVVDLLKLANPGQDAISGTWRLHDGMLTSDESENARIGFAYQPPTEYDQRIVFVRTTGNDAITVICHAGGRQFALIIAGWKNEICEFDRVKNEEGINATVAGSPAWLKNGTPYTLLLKVRDNGIRAFLDGKLICKWGNNFKDLGMPGNWKIQNHNMLGVGTYRSSTNFTTIEVTDISGDGQKLR